MQLFGIAIVLLGCTSFGFFIDYTQKRRVQELEGFIYSFEWLKAEIDYRLTPIPEACKEMLSMPRVATRNVFVSFAKKLNEKISIDGKALWIESIEENKEAFYLVKEDWEIVEEFGSVDCFFDKEMEKKMLERIIYKLAHVHKREKEVYERKSKLNRMMGVLVGIGISILLI
jgi:stage III sporulation protein AB